jgi:hypothetical protein
MIQSNNRVVTAVCQQQLLIQKNNQCSTCGHPSPEGEGLGGEVAIHSPKSSIHPESSIATL